MNRCFLRANMLNRSCDSVADTVSLHQQVARETAGVAGPSLPAWSKRCALVLALGALIVVAGCSKPDPLTARCQKQIKDQLAGSGSFVKHSSSHTVLPGTTEQKIGVLNSLKTRVTDKRYNQLIDFHIPQLRTHGDNAGVSNIKIEFDLKFSGGGVQPRVGNCYYFWNRVGSSDPKTLAIIVAKRRASSS